MEWVRVVFVLVKEINKKGLEKRDMWVEAQDIDRPAVSSSRRCLLLTKAITEGYLERIQTHDNPDKKNNRSYLYRLTKRGRLLLRDITP